MTDRAVSLIPPFVVIWLAALAVILATPGCGSVSPAARSSYAAEVSRCEDAEDVIRDRQGTTEAQDLADLRALREECAASLAIIGGTP